MKAGEFRDDVQHSKSAVVFIVLWSVAMLMHLFRKHFLLDIYALPIIFGACISLFYPKKLWPFLLTISGTVLYLVKKMPFTDNHLYIMTFVGMAVCATMLNQLRTGGVRGFDFMESVENSFPFVRLTLLVAYMGAALAKFNSDFFNPEISCAVTMTYDAADMLVLLGIVDSVSLPSFFERALPGLIAGVELAIPILLFFSRTRVLGVFTIVIFHFLLSFSYTATALDFTIMLFAIVVIFLPLQTRIKLSENYLGIISRLKPAVVLVPFTLLWTFLIIGRKDFFGFIPFEVGMWVVLASTALFLSVYILCAVLKQNGWYKSYSLGFSVRGFQMVVFLLLFLNIASPYLGGKTVSSFTMYSNLNTTVENFNHYFIPRWPAKTKQDDLVRIVYSTNQHLNNIKSNYQLITYHELQRWLIANQQDSTVYERNNLIHTYSPVQRDSQLEESHWLWYKLIGHRAVYQEANYCSW